MRRLESSPWFALCLVVLVASPLGCMIAEVGGGDDIDEDGLPNDDADTSRQITAACRPEERPAARAFDQPTEGYAGYAGQSRCDPVAKPGVVAFSKLVLDTYPCTRSGGIVRACSVGDRSEHKEGRAWDWMVSSESPAAATLLHWLLARDPAGHDDVMARRLGIMYMIFNRRIWKSYEAGQGWQHYPGTNPHTDHVHFSFSWEGARKRTSYWDAPLNHLPRGWLQTAHCATGISGWSQDPNEPKQSVRVELRVADKELAVAADEYRADLCDKLESCRHGFTAAVPAALKDGQLHHVRAFAVDTTTHERVELEGSPKDFNCTP
jgi:hypothetical protein